MYNIHFAQALILQIKIDKLLQQVCTITIIINHILIHLIQRTTNYLTESSRASTRINNTTHQIFF